MLSLSFPQTLIHIVSFVPKSFVSSLPSATPRLLDLLLQRRLVHGGVAHIPGLDDQPLRLVEILLVLDVPHADLDAVLGEDDVLLVHARRRRVADLSSAHVDVVAHEAGDADDDEEDDEGEELPTRGAMRLVSFDCSDYCKGRTRKQTEKGPPHEERGVWWWFTPRHCEGRFVGCLVGSLKCLEKCDLGVFCQLRCSNGWFYIRSAHGTL